MSPAERRENSSIFLNAHDCHLGDDHYQKHATVSSTVIIITDDNKLYFWERLYKHEESRRPLSDLDYQHSMYLSEAFDYLDPREHFENM